MTKAKPNSANAEGIFEPFPITEVPQTGRVDVKLMRQGYRGSATMDYWDDIDAGDKIRGGDVRCITC